MHSCLGQQRRIDRLAVEYECRVNPAWPVPGLAELLPDTGPNAHQVAYIYALCGQGDAAVAALTRAIAHGEPVELIRQEDEFRALRARADYQALVGGGR